MNVQYHYSVKVLTLKIIAMKLKENEKNKGRSTSLTCVGQHGIDALSLTDGSTLSSYSCNVLKFNSFEKYEKKSIIFTFSKILK